MAMRGRTSLAWGEAGVGAGGKEGGGGKRINTYNTTNLRGLSVKTGNRAKQITKHARAPRLQAPNMRRRSHRLTVAHLVSPVAKAGHPAVMLGSKPDSIC